MTEEEPYFGNNMTRQKAHDHLDLLINLLVAEGESAPTFNDQREEGAVGEEGAMVGDGQRQAIYLFQLAVGYISTIIGGETICAAVPWHKGEAPSELRQQLVDMLRLVEPVWGERSEGNAFIYTALGSGPIDLRGAI